MPLPPKISDLTSALQLIPHPEGGFFVETYRSGCDPMSTKGQTGLGCTEPNINLVHANGRGNNRQDGDVRRNCLTSIYWVPTIASPKLLLAKNHSDHIHYYHGGLSFKYYIYNPDTGVMVEEILGPDIHRGHKLQVCVAGGLWKCGHLIEDKDCVNNESYEYTCIGEAVAPGKAIVYNYLCLTYFVDITYTFHHSFIYYIAVYSTPVLTIYNIIYFLRL